MLTVIRGRGDSIALTKSLIIAAWAVLSRRACPLSRFAPALPKGEPFVEEGRPLKNKKRRRKLFAAKSASCLTRTGDTLINSQVL